MLFRFEPVESTGDAAIEGLARRQHGCVHREQLKKAGLTRHGLKWRVDHGRLFRIRPDVFLVGRRSPEALTAQMSAVLQYRAAAVLGGRSAARLLGLVDDEPARVELCCVGDWHRERDDVLIRTSRYLTAKDVWWRRGVPIMSGPTTLLQLAGIVDEYELENALSQAFRKGVVRQRRFTEWVEQITYKPKGIGTLRAILYAAEHPADTRSKYERKLLKLIRESGLPQPVTNVTVCGLLVDFYWPAQRMVVEFDSRTFHLNPVSFDQDRRRDQLLLASDILPIRVTKRHLDLEADRIVSMLTEVAGRR